jgi:hypothetical protein
MPSHPSSSSSFFPPSRFFCWLFIPIPGLVLCLQNIRSFHSFTVETAHAHYLLTLSLLFDKQPLLITTNTPAPQNTVYRDIPLHKPTLSYIKTASIYTTSSQIKLKDLVSLPHCYPSYPEDAAKGKRRKKKRKRNSQSPKGIQYPLGDTHS